MRLIVAVLVGLCGGVVLGVILAFVWYFIGIIFLGFGDSGPQWFNEVTKWVRIVSIPIGGLIAVIFYVKKLRSSNTL